MGTGLHRPPASPCRKQGAVQGLGVQEAGCGLQCVSRGVSVGIEDHLESGLHIDPLLKSHLMTSARLRMMKRNPCPRVEAVPAVLLSGIAPKRSKES